MAYKAVIASLKSVRVHSNANRLQLATVAGEQIVVGLDNHEGQMGCYFSVDGQLSEKFAIANDLIRRKDANGNVAGGLFEENRRIRAQKIRGERSYGFWIPTQSLVNAGIKQKTVDSLKEGYEFDELDGIPICNKYETPATKSAREHKQTQSRNETHQFRMHFETPQLKRMVNKVPNGSLLIITEKLHGTSHRVGRVLDIPLVSGWKSIYRQLLNFIGRDLEPEYRYVHGSRRVLLDNWLTDNYHGSDFRVKATEPFNNQLKKGEVVYLEIVGWAGETTIMPAHNVKKLGEKEMVAKYGEKMEYLYGQPKGTAKAYVYRITQVNEDGYSIELSWEQVKARCKELGVWPVPELDRFIYDGNSESLITNLEKLAVGPSVLGPTHIREGVCVRVEHAAMDKEFVAKLKSWQFLTMEMSSKDDETVVDIEESA